jgi:hypothetical protein
MIAERAQPFLIKFIGIGYFGDTMDRHLSGQCKLSAKKSLIAELVQIVLSKRLILLSAFGEPVAHLIVKRLRETQFVFLLWRWLQSLRYGAYLTETQWVLLLLPEVGTLRAWENL